MSRTYRHTPIVKAGKRESNKEFKVHAHRNLRHKTKEVLSHEEPDEIFAPEKMREVSEIWTSKQDYKWKEFRNFWDKRYTRLKMEQEIYPPSRTKKAISRYMKFCKMLFRQMFYR